MTDLENKFNEYIKRFNEEVSTLEIHSAAFNNKWFQKLNALPLEALNLLINEMKTNNNMYMIPIIAKFYPNFSILRRDKGRMKHIYESLLDHIEHNSPKEFKK